MDAESLRSLDGLPRLARRGRGALSNASGRFETARRVPLDDGWDESEALPPLRTTVERDTARQVITRNDSPDIGFDRSLNPYRGCEHGCVYCFARPSHAFLGLSPGLDFETRLFAKPDAAALLARELRRPGYVPGVLALGTNTDPYQPIEQRLGITRAVLEVLADFGHPVTIITKSARITRDLDVLAPMGVRRLVKVAVSITTLDRGLARRMEPRAATPARRLDTIRALSVAGIPVSVLVAPVIPGLTDWELDLILRAAREAGAVEAGYVLLRLPHELKDLFREWLDAHVPGQARKVMALLRAVRAGRDYDPEWGTRMTGSGPYADMIAQRFRLATRRLGLNARHFGLDITQFHPPPQAGEQLGLFADRE